MPNIITTTKAQKIISKIANNIEEQTYIVTNHGQGKIVMLPYYDGCDDNVSDYMEDFEMIKNKEKLQKRYHDSSKSGKSSLII